MKNKTAKGYNFEPKYIKDLSVPRLAKEFAIGLASLKV